MRIKVSVVVAVYNISPYIEQCLRSVYQQTLDGIEIVIVNDGSTDNSLEIIQKVLEEEKSNTIIANIITQPNAGLSAARNTGEKHAQGEFLHFLDGDDWLDKDMLKEMYDAAIKNKAEVVICDYKRCYADRVEEVTGGNIPAVVQVNEKEGLRLFFDGKIVIAAWNKLFLTSFYRRYNFKFPSDVWFEDIPLTLLIAKSNAITKIDKPFYNYRQREGSIMKTLSLKTLRKVDLVNNIEKYIMEKGFYASLFANFQRFYCELIILQVINDTIKNGRQEKNIRDEIIYKTLGMASTKKYLQKIFLNPNISVKHKVGLFLLKYFPKLYIYIFEGRAY